MISITNFQCSVCFFWITSDFSFHIMHFTSELQTPITFLFVNENIKCGCACVGVTGKVTFFFGKYQIYFISWVENTWIFTRAAHSWKFWCFQHSRLDIFGIQLKKGIILYCLFWDCEFSDQYLQSSNQHTESNKTDSQTETKFYIQGWHRCVDVRPACSSSDPS